MILSHELADEVWTVLVEECGANENDRENFVFLTNIQDIAEYRFIGNLGFGGKFWSGKFIVSCYPEDSNEMREAAIQKANARLAALKECE